MSVASGLASGDLPLLLPQIQSLGNCPATAICYLECSSHVGEVSNAASDDEDLAWVWSGGERKESKQGRQLDLSSSSGYLLLTIP